MKYILLTQREQTDRYGEKIDVLEAAYTVFFSSLGYIPITVSNFFEQPRKLMEFIKPTAIVLTGGGCLPTAYYDQNYGYEEQKNRDRVEKELLITGMKQRIPILGICRGMQFINGYFGGKVSRLQFPEGERSNGKDHPLICRGETLWVNNYHNDGIYKKKLATELTSIAEDTEYGVVEGFFAKDKKVLGIQWHPERKFSNNDSRDKTRELIREFLSVEDD